MDVDIFGNPIEVEVEEEVKASLPSFFDILDDICVTKKHIVSRETIKCYNTYQVNRALSQHLDTILLAYELNKQGDIDPLMHYEYLMLTVRPKKRYGKWAKADVKDEKTISLLSHHFQVSYKQAEEYMNIITNAELNIIFEQYNEGGKIKWKHHT